MGNGPMNSSCDNVQCLVFEKKKYLEDIGKTNARNKIY